MFEAFEPLMGGAWSRAAAPLQSDEEALLGRHFRPGEAMERFVRGRGQGVGWTLWALTPERLIFLNLNGKQPPRTHPHAAVRRVDAQAGKWGATLVMEIGGTRESIFGADSALGDRFLEAVAAYCPNVVAPDKLAPETAPVAAPPGVDAASVPPARVGGVASDDGMRLVEALREAASLREKGMLSEDEFALVKRRLLGG